MSEETEATPTDNEACDDDEVDGDDDTETNEHKDEDNGTNVDSSVPYMCGICDEQFTDTASLKDHAMIHVGHKLHCCPLCAEMFAEKADLQAHIETHSSFDRPYKCKLCDKRFTQLSSLNAHHRSHASKPFMCDVCNKSFTHPGSLKSHMKIHAAVQRFTCLTCDKNFLYASKLRDHMRTHLVGVVADYPFECETCRKKFKDSRRYQEHLRRHTGEKPYSCTVCGKSFVSYTERHKHMRTHSGERPYECNLCDKSYTQASDLKRHMFFHAGIEDRPFVCDVCNKGFQRNSDLKKHVRIHTGEKPHKCDQCDKSFKQISHLQSHAFMHFDGKIYVCKIKTCKRRFKVEDAYKKHMEGHSGQLAPLGCIHCDKSFGTKSKLDQHMRTHAPPADKQYSCNLCEKTFPDIVLLREHFKDHDEKEKMYSCEVCEKKFTTLQSLRVHRRMHTGEKPYECPECHKRYTKNSYLKSHLRSHSGERPFACEVCPKRYSTAGALLRHNQRKHGKARRVTCGRPRQAECEYDQYVYTAERDEVMKVINEEDESDEMSDAESKGDAKANVFTRSGDIKLELVDSNLASDNAEYKNSADTFKRNPNDDESMSAEEMSDAETIVTAKGDFSGNPGDLKIEPVDSNIGNISETGSESNTNVQECQNVGYGVSHDKIHNTAVASNNLNLIDPNEIKTEPFDPDFQFDHTSIAVTDTWNMDAYTLLKQIKKEIESDTDEES